MKLLGKIKILKTALLSLNYKLIIRNARSVAFYSTLGVGSLGSIFGLLYLEQKRSSIQCAQIVRDQHDEESPKSLALCMQDAVNRSRVLLERIKTELNCPGITIAVTVDGEEVWKEGLGLADIENGIPCTPDTVMRIASISKPMTMAIVAKLVENGNLDLDENVCNYVPEWPTKTFQGKESKITTRMLTSMLGGIRSYDKSCGIKTDKKKKEGVAATSEFDNTEYYITKPYKSVIESLDIFKQEDLCSQPGTAFLYSTYSFVLVSAVIEKVVKKKFEAILKDMFRELNLKNTYLDENLPIIHNRARYYRLESNRLQNAPYVNNSYKWAGGGLQSTASDVCLFGNTMLACYQGVADQGSTKDHSDSTADEKKSKSEEHTPYFTPYLSKKTMEMIWTPLPKTTKGMERTPYAMGWEVYSARPQINLIYPDQTNHKNRKCIYHTGGAVGASSILLIMPRDAHVIAYNPSRAPKNPESTKNETATEITDTRPRGTVVAIITNMQSAGLRETAREIAVVFEDNLEKYSHRVKVQTMDLANNGKSQRGWLNYL